MNDSSLQTDASQRMKAHMRAEETLLWTGTPAQGFLVKREDRMNFPIVCLMVLSISSLTLGALTGDITPRGWEPGDPPYIAFMIVLGLFALLFVSLLSHTYLSDRRKRKTLVYAVSSERVLFDYGREKPGLVSLPLSSTPTMNLELWPDGRGTIQFFDEAQFAGVGFSRALGGWPDGSAFHGIEGPQDVFKLIRTARQAWTAAERERRRPLPPPPPSYSFFN